MCLRVFQNKHLTHPLVAYIYPELLLHSSISCSSNNTHIKHFTKSEQQKIWVSMQMQTQQKPCLRVRARARNLVMILSDGTVNFNPFQ